MDKLIQDIKNFLEEFYNFILLLLSNNNNNNGTCYILIENKKIVETVAIIIAGIILIGVVIIIAFSLAETWYYFKKGLRKTIKYGPVGVKFRMAKKEQEEREYKNASNPNNWYNYDPDNPKYDKIKARLARRLEKKNKMVPPPKPLTEAQKRALRKERIKKELIPSMILFFGIFAYRIIFGW